MRGPPWWRQECPTETPAPALCPADRWKLPAIITQCAYSVIRLVDRCWHALPLSSVPRCALLAQELIAVRALRLSPPRALPYISYHLRPALYPLQTRTHLQLLDRSNSRPHCFHARVPPSVTWPSLLSLSPLLSSISPYSLFLLPHSIIPFSL